MKRTFATAACAVLTTILAPVSVFAQPTPYPDPYAPVYIPRIYARYGYGPANLPRNILGEPSEPEATPDEVYLENYRRRYYTIALAHPYAAVIDLIVPAGSELWFQGLKTRQKGSFRFFESPPLEPGKTYTYTIKTVWTNAKGEKVERTRAVQIRAGDYLRLDLRRD